MRPRVFLPAILSGPLLWAAFFPLDLGPLAFVALVPWLSLVRAENVTAKRRYLAAYVGGLAFFVPALQWVRVADPMMHLSWLAMSLYCALYWPLALFLLRKLDRLGRPPLALTFPVVWVALEYVRAHFPTGFPFLSAVRCYQLIGFGWYFLGHPLHQYSLLIQVCDLGGVYVLSFVVAAVNGAAFEWLDRLAGVKRLFRQSWTYHPGFYREMWATTAAVGLLLGVIAYGGNQLQHPDFALGPRVAAIQGDIEQDAKATDPRSLFRTYKELSDRAALRADLVVWPETCFPYSLYTVAPGTDPRRVDPELLDIGKSNRDALTQFGREWNTNVLVGLTIDETDGTDTRKWNAAVLTGPDGVGSEMYAKMHLVPFGEYVPLKKTFPWLQMFTPYKHDYSCTPGDQFTRFPLTVGETPYTFGVLVCYEDSDPYLARQYVRPGAEPVDFLVNISNDGWFKGTEQHEQHLAICRFRAVEARRTVVRAVNMGISAVIDPDGRVIALPGDNWAKSKRMEGTVTVKIPLDRRPSRYAAWGDWVPATCWLLLVAGLVAARFRRR